MSTKTKLTISLAGVAIIVLVILFLNVDKPNSTAISEAKSLARYDNNYPIKTGFSYQVALELSLEQGGVNRTSTGKITFLLEFQPDEFIDDAYKGIVHGFEYGGETQVDPSDNITKLGFKLNRTRNSWFDNIDLLGLPENHSYAIINKLIPQLSYLSEGKTGTIALSDGHYTYEYKDEDAGGKTRKIILVNHRAEFEKGATLVSNNEEWFLQKSKDDWPERMKYSINRTTIPKKIDSKMDQVEPKPSKISQFLTIERINASVEIDWNDPMLFDIQSNSRYKKTSVDTETMGLTIASDAEMLSALASLEGRISSELAKALGLYILSEKSLTDIENYLNDPNISSRQQSLIIYALQKVATLEAELALGSLAKSTQITSENRSRSIVSLGQFGNNSVRSITVMQELLEDTDEFVADTALLNLGVIAKNAPSVAEHVREILRELVGKDSNLQANQKPNSANADSDLYLQLMSIGNTDDPTYDDLLYPYIEHQEFQIRGAALGVLARRKDHQDMVLTKVLQEKNPNVVDLITKNIINFQNIPVPSGYLNAIRNSILKTTIPETQSRRLNFHLALSPQHTNRDIDFLKQLFSSDKVSTIDKQKIQDYLVQTTKQ